MSFEARVAAVIDAREARAGAEEFNRAHRSMVEQAKHGTGEIAGTFRELKGEILSFAAQFGLAFSAAHITHAIIERANEMQVLRGELEGAVGSAQKAGVAWDFIGRTAEATGSDVRTLTRSFIDLVNVGVDPTNGSLVALTDIAARFRTTLGGVTDAAQQAAVGQTRGLRQYGVAVKDFGDQIELVSVATGRSSGKVDKDTQTIVNAFVRLKGPEVAGASKELSNTTSKALEDIGNKFAEFADKVGRAGLNRALRDFALEIQHSISGADNFAEAVGVTMAKSIDTATDAFRFGKEHFEAIENTLIVLGSARIASGLLGLATTIKTLTTAIEGLGATRLVAFMIANPVVAAAVLAAGTGALAIKAGRDFEAERSRRQPLFDPLSGALPPEFGADPSQRGRFPSTGREQEFQQFLNSEQGKLFVPVVPVFDKRAMERTAADFVDAVQGADFSFGGASSSFGRQPKPGSSVVDRAADHEAERQAQIRQSIALLQQEADAQKALANATLQSKDLAAAQASGDFRRIDAANAAILKQTVDQEALAAAQSAGIDVTGDLSAAEERWINQMTGSIRVTHEATTAAQHYSDAHNTIQQAIEQTRTPVEQYNHDLFVLKQSYETVGKSMSGASEEAIAFERAQRHLEEQKAENQVNALASARTLPDVADLTKSQDKFFDTAAKAWAQYEQQGRNAFETIADFGTKGLQGLENLGAEFLQGQVTGWKQLGQVVEQEIAQMIAHLLLLQAKTAFLNFAGSAGGWLGTFFGAAQTGASIAGAGGNGGGVTGGAGGNGAFVAGAFQPSAFRMPAIPAPNMPVSVTVNNPPGAETPEVTTRQNPGGGVSLEITYRNFRDRFIHESAQGGAIMPLLRRGGFNPGPTLPR